MMNLNNEDVCASILSFSICFIGSFVVSYFTTICCKYRDGTSTKDYPVDIDVWSLPDTTQDYPMPPIIDNDDFYYHKLEDDVKKHFYHTGDELG